MKKKLLVLSLLVFLINCTKAQNVNIPDANFKALLLSDTTINSNQDTAIQVSEALNYTGAIDASNSNIADFTGIEDFGSLTNLNCSYNQLTNLNLSNNTLLTSINCTGNQINSLDVINNTLLLTLDCSNNQLTTLNTVNNPLLTNLTCNNNQIGALNLSSNTALTIIICSGNQMGDLQISNNTLLNTINASFNQISFLDFSSNISLKNLQIQNNLIQNIDFGVIDSIVNLICYNNQLTNMDLSYNTGLISIQCNDNKLKGLNLSSSSSLTELWCYNNELEYLNVQNGNNINFTDFDAQYNPLLTCIMVDSVTFSNANWPLIDPASNFSTFCTALGVRDIEIRTITVFPNPAYYQIKALTEKGIEPKSWSILSGCGTEMIRSTWNGNSISVETLHPGMYILSLQFLEKTINLKFIKG
jgi:Leucine-rich repeat (LRR) protein